MIKTFDRLLFVIAGALVVVMLGTVTAGVLFRAVNHPLRWTDEASGYIMVWLASAGWMIATRRRAHIRIRFFQDKLGTHSWRWTEVGFQLCLALFGGVIAWHSADLVHTNADIESMALPVSVAWMYMPLLPAGLVTLAQALAELWQQLDGKGRPEPVAQEAPAS